MYMCKRCCLPKLKFRSFQVFFPFVFQILRSTGDILKCGLNGLMRHTTENCSVAIKFHSPHLNYEQFLKKRLRRTFNNKKFFHHKVYITHPAFSHPCHRKKDERAGKTFLCVKLWGTGNVYKWVKTWKTLSHALAVHYFLVF